MQKPDKFFTPESVGSLYGATFMVLVLSGYSALLLHGDPRWIALFIAPLVAFIGLASLPVPPDAKRWSLMNVFLAFTNGALLYFSATGMNTINYGLAPPSPKNAPSPKDAPGTTNAAPPMNATLLPQIDPLQWWPSPDVASLKATLEDKDAKLAESDKELQKLRTQSVGSLAELQKLRTQSAEADKELQKLRTQSVESVAENQRLRSDMAKLETTNAEFAKRVRVMSDELGKEVATTSDLLRRQSEALRRVERQASAVADNAERINADVKGFAGTSKIQIPAGLKEKADKSRQEAIAIRETVMEIVRLQAAADAQAQRLRKLVETTARLSALK